MTSLRPWLAAGRPERALLAPLGVAVGSSYAHFDAQPGPGLPAHALVTVAAFFAGFGVNLIDHGWDHSDEPDEARDSLIAGVVALALAGLIGLGLAPLSGSAALGYGCLAVLVGVIRRAPVAGPDGLGWGLGDLVTLLALGPLASLAGFASQAGTGSWGAVMAGLPAGMVCAAAGFWRHVVEGDADGRLGRLTPLQTLGASQARTLLVALPALAAGAVALAVRAREYGPWSNVAIVPLAAAAVAAWRLPYSADRVEAERWERWALGCAAAALAGIILGLRIASPD